MINYSIYYKEKYSTLGSLSGCNQWDYYISAFRFDERVRRSFADIKAHRKDWLIFPEYKYVEDEYPKTGTGEYVVELSGKTESEIIHPYAKRVKAAAKNKHICVDITGFIRPHLMFFLKCLKREGIHKFDVIYTEPKWYKERELTKFSYKVLDVRLVHGYEGIQELDDKNDLLIIGSGYDDQLIAAVANKKSSIRNKIQIFGLPPLSPAFYQENRLCAYRAEDVKDSEFDFAPAYDPFATAEKISNIVRQKNPTNLYLCPLATKPQVLGFALYYLLERENTATNIIHPFYESYSKETSEKVGRIWKYRIEFPEA
jgi:hypothetical protein